MLLRFRAVGAVAGIALLVAGGRPAALAPENAVPKKPDDRTVVHVLNRLGFGPSTASREQVARMGLDAYIDVQLHPERLPDTGVRTRLQGFMTLDKSSRELAAEYFVPAMRERLAARRREPGGASPSSEPVPATPEQMAAQRQQRAPLAELSQQKILRAAYSERQLEEVLVDFWFNHFNVFVGKGPVRLYLAEYERDAIRPHVFGRFRELLGATASSPAMLFYLDNWQSAAPEGAPTAGDPARGRRRRMLEPAKAPQRRGLNENYARELMELHTLGVDGGYTQKDVQEVARAFTGWTIETPRLGGGFRFDPRLHDDGEKVILGHRIKGGGGRRDGEQVLDLLAAHPSTARYIATKLARRFISDMPPAPLVDRAAARFRATHGDLREVVRTIVTSPEFFDAAAVRAKVKSPFEFVVSAVRALDADAANPLPLVQAVRDLGMPLYGAQPPTGYVDRAESWVNSGALLNRMNFAVALTGNRLRLGAAQLAAPPSPDEAGRAFVATALAGDVSDGTAATVARATTTPQALALLLGSPEFQKR